MQAQKIEQNFFLTFPVSKSQKNISNMNSYCSNSSDMRNLNEQVKKAFSYQNLFWPFTVWINCSSDLKFFANSRPRSFFRSQNNFFLTIGQNNFCNKIPKSWDFFFNEEILFNLTSFSLYRYNAYWNSYYVYHLIFVKCPILCNPGDWPTKYIINNN